MPDKMAMRYINLPDTEDCNTLTLCLKVISELAPIKFEENGSNNFMVLPLRKDLEFSIIDNTSKEFINTISVKVNDDFENYYYPKKSIYTIKDVFPLDSIHIHSAFYKSIHLIAAEIIQKNNTIALEQETIDLNEVIITDYLTRGINAKISDNSILGVHNPSGKPGSLNFRGNTFDQSLIQIDDIPIYHTGHFFGALSPYNPAFIDKIEIQRNTLPAKWGGRVGGLINMTTSTTVPDSTVYGAQANTIYGGATVKVPVIKNKLAETQARTKRFLEIWI